MGMLPGVGKIKDQLDAAGLDDRVITRQEAIISSMTRAERANHAIINGSRRLRIAVYGKERYEALATSYHQRFGSGLPRVV